GLGQLDRPSGVHLRNGAGRPRGGVHHAAQRSRLAHSALGNRRPVAAWQERRGSLPGQDPVGKERDGFLANLAARILSTSHRKLGSIFRRKLSHGCARFSGGVLFGAKIASDCWISVYIIIPSAKNRTPVRK